LPGIKNFKGKVAVITGAGSGIGRATAHAFAKEGAIPVIADIHQERIENVKKEIKALGVEAASMVADVSDKAQVEALSEFVLNKYERVDILHNNAGIGWGGPLEVFPLEDFQKVMAVNFWGVIYGVQSFLPRMIKQKSGHIVNTASGAGLNGVIPLGAYSASKFAIVGYSEVLRAELRRHNIGVTTICPGIINTNIVKDGKATLIEGARADQEKMTAFYKRFGWPPERVAKGVLKGVRKNKAIVPVGPEVWIGWYIKRFSITLSDMINSMIARFTL